MSKTKRRCAWCGKPERINSLGYSNIAPSLGYCIRCITAALLRRRPR